MKMKIIPKENTSLECYESFILKNHTMNERVDHPQLEMLIGHLLVDGQYL
jgi:hypothetical protein